MVFLRNNIIVSEGPGPGPGFEPVPGPGSDLSQGLLCFDRKGRPRLPGAHDLKRLKLQDIVDLVGPEADNSEPCCWSECCRTVSVHEVISFRTMYATLNQHSKAQYLLSQIHLWRTRAAAVREIVKTGRAKVWFFANKPVCK